MIKQYLIQIKIAAFILAFVLSNTFAVWATYQVVTGREAKKDKKVIIEIVENHNEDLISQQEHSNEIAKIQKQYEAKLSAINLVSSVDTCPISDFERVWNEAAAVANSYTIQN